MRKLELLGKVFGQLTVIQEAGFSNSCGFAMWVCKCSCGSETTVPGAMLSAGRVKSCGCLRKSAMAVVGRSNRGKPNTRVHGHRSRTRSSGTYISWLSVRQRCSNPDDKYYGGRGISVCSRWQNSFVDFLADMGDRPSGCEIDRIDSNGNYEPANCRWWPAGKGARRDRPCV